VARDGNHLKVDVLVRSELLYADLMALELKADQTELAALSEAPPATGPLIDAPVHGKSVNVGSWPSPGSRFR